MDDVSPVAILSVKPANDFGARRIDFRARSVVARDHASAPGAPLPPLPLPAAPSLGRARAKPTIAPDFPIGSLRPAKAIQKPLSETRLSPVELGHVTVAPQRPSGKPVRVLPPSRLEARRNLSSKTCDDPSPIDEARTGPIKRPLS